MMKPANNRRSRNDSAVGFSNFAPTGFWLQLKSLGLRLRGWIAIPCCLGLAGCPQATPVEQAKSLEPVSSVADVPLRTENHTTLRVEFRPGDPPIASHQHNAEIVVENQPATKTVAAVEGPTHPVIVDRTKPVVGENGRIYSPASLHKNNSLLVLAFEPDIRAEFITMPARSVLDSEQIQKAKQLALNYDDQFQELTRRRAAILENASDDKNVDQQLLKLQLKQADLVRQIRQRINNELMTPEQQKTALRLFDEELILRARIAEQDNEAAARQAE